MATLWTLFVLFMTLISICRGDKGSCFTGLTVWFEEYPMPDLPYNLTDLEPYIDGQTVDVHYNGHLGGYRNKMNALLPKLRADVRSKSYAATYKSLWWIYTLHGCLTWCFYLIKSNVSRCRFSDHMGDDRRLVIVRVTASMLPPGILAAPG